MPHPIRNATRALSLLLSMLLAITLVAPGAFASSGSGEVDASGCGGCCVAASSDACVSVCAPAAPAAQVEEQTPAKPLGAWCAGVVRAPCIAPLQASLWAMAPASGSLGPPPYLSFGRLLL
jgi:hypothetical protein